MADSSVEHQQSNDRFALLVLGMHRSGTSAVTRVASLLGADLPKKLMVPKPGENESGFWESVELYDLQEELLASGGSSWDDWRPFNPNWLDSPAAEPFISRFVEHLQDDFAESALFVVKDPRCCRLMPVWRQILDNMGVDARVLLPVRNPLEVAESLSKRNGTSPARAYIIWLRHVLDAEHDSRGIPRLIFDYDDLLQDWRTFASQASQALAISWPADSAQTSAKIDAFLSSSHRHHTFDEDQLLAHPTVSKWVKNTYSALKMLAKDPESQKALRLLDKIRADFNDAGDTFGDVMASEEIVSQELQSRLVSSENSCELLQTQIDDVESRVIPLEEEKNSLEHHFAAKQSELEKLQAAMREKSLESAQVQQELADSKDRHEKDHSLMVSQFDEYRSLLVAKSEEDRRLLASKTEEDRSLLASQFEEDRSALVSQFENERSLKELYAGSRSDLLNRLNEIQMSSTWRLAESLYNIEVRRPWLVRWLGMSSVALRGFTVLHPVKHWRLHWDARVVQNLGLFDWEWYIEGNADVVAAGADPLKHWLREGWKDGRKPNPYFDTSWYMRQYLSDSNDDTNPLLHYIRECANTDVAPNPEFNTKKYLQQHPEIQKDGINPLVYFLKNHGGAKQGERPFETDSSEHAPGAESYADVPAGNKTENLHQTFEQTIRFSQLPGPLYEEEKPHPNPDPLIKAIAFYLPQFHPIPENDANWGKGFTEWSNTSRTLPRFGGHYQPRTPGELGYYDLRNPEIHRRQIELAKANGIAGFCYHHYWFNGKSLLRMPIERHLADPTLDLGFCINWANEPWTAAWDGHSESGVLVEQHHSPEDDLAFIQDIEPFLRDPRYIRVEGKPLLSIYRPTLFPNMPETIERWQNYCIDQGIGELFIVMVQSFEFNDPKPYGFNGAIEFPPHNAARESFEPIEFFPDTTLPDVWDYKVMAEYSRNRPSEEFSWFRGVTLGWDNSARKLEGWVFQGGDPHTYGEWLEGQCDNAVEELPPGQRLVFINAWNEWAEGTYLEPDAHFGYAFLNRTGEVLQKYRKTGTPDEALLDYIKARHDDKTAQWLTQHFVQFGLPVTSAEVDLADPSDGEVDSWLELLIETADRNAGRLSESEPDVSIVIPVYNQIRYTLSCLVSLLSHPGKYTMELIIGDDCSTDLTAKLDSLSIPGLHYIRHPNNLGFLKNCNEIAERARGRYLVMLNNDTVTLPEWLDSLIDTLDGEDDVGLVGSKLVYPDGKLQEAGGIMWEDASGLNWGNLKDPLHPDYNYRREVDYCSGASIALSTELWRKLEGFDGSRYQNAYYEDTDIAFRVREDMKLRVLYQPLSHLLHFEGVSSGRSLDAGIKQYQKSNQPVFQERWREVLAKHGSELQHPENFLCRGRTKNLLLIDWITPMPDQDSGSADTFYYLKIFETMGFNVTLLPEKNTKTDRYVRDVQEMGVRVLHDPYVGDFESMLKVEVPKADVIFVYRGAAHRHAPLIRQLAPDTPIVFDTVDLHFLREEREAEVIGTKKARDLAAQTKEKELQAMRLSDATIVLSEYEEKLLGELVPDVNVARIPIVREIPGRSSDSFEQRRDVIFIGGFLHRPNVGAVQYFVKKVWPLVRRESFDRPCRFVIVGSNIPPEIAKLADKDIVIKGFVDDLGDVFDNALISVSPLQYGAGLKGKVVSSLSYGVPVVCTTISSEGSGLEHGKNVMIGDNPKDIAQYIAELHRDAELWQQISDNGLEFCNKNFSLQSVGGKLATLLDQLDVS
jgi:GT2 family glycosyltransferase/glycosyltransferase involved in cell wall biosynthesis